VLARWKHPRLKRGWEAWGVYIGQVMMERAEEAEEAARQQLQAAYRSLEALKAQAAEDQACLQAESVQRMQLQATAREEADRRLGLCKRVVRRLMRQGLARAWVHFVTSIEACREQWAVVQRVLQRLRNRLLAAAFLSYAAHVAELAMQRQRVLRTLVRA
jgi:hypothetical protein